MGVHSEVWTGGRRCSCLSLSGLATVPITLVRRPPVTLNGIRGEGERDGGMPPCVLASVFFGLRVPLSPAPFWIPACAGMTDDVVAGMT